MNFKNKLILVIVRLGLMGNSQQSWPALYDWCQRVAMAFPERE